MPRHPFAPRGPRIMWLSLGTGLISATAAAAPQPPALVEPPATRATPIPVPGQAGQFEARVPTTAVGQAQANTFFLNYDGVTLKSGGLDNAATNTTMFGEWAKTFQPYGQGAKRAASLQAVKADWAKYDVTVTDVRPQSGPYTMSVNSPTNIYGGGVLGVAPLDCGDDIASNIVLAFHSANDQFSAATQATTMSQEIAHSYGLEHVNEPNDIMNPYNAGADPTFLDKCINLDGGGNPIQCGAQHQQFCNGGQQNSHKELVWLFGLSEPDPVPPTVAITYPKNGDQFDAPATITITAEASDNVGVAQVDLLIDGANQNVPVVTPPYQWKDASFPEGTYCLTVEARDDEPNVATSAEVCFSVVKAGEETTSDPTTSDPTTSDPTTSDPTTATGGETGGSETGNGETGGGETGATTEAPTTSATGEPPSPDSDSDSEGGGSVSGLTAGPGLPPGWGGDDDSDEGCGCRQNTPAGASALGLVLLLGLGRRRRTR